MMQTDIKVSIVLSILAIGVLVFVLRRYRTALLGYTLFNVFLIASVSFAGFWSWLILQTDDYWITPEHITVFNYSALGLISLGLGILVAWRPLRKADKKHERRRATRKWYLPRAAWINPWFIYLCLGIGTVAYLLQPYVFSIPTASAIWTNFRQFLNIGVLVGLCYGLISRDFQPLLIGLGVFVFLAMLTMLASGHVGAFAPILFQGAVIIFLARRVKLSKMLLLLPLVIPLTGLYVGWMETRSLIRGGYLNNLPTSQAASIFVNTLLDNSDVFDMNAQEVHDAIMIRLDGTTILAAQVNYQPDYEPYAYGKTVTEDLLAALVPRFLWPDKPIRAGGSAFVSRYSGLKWDEWEVSVGLPYQFELYANGGPWVVIIGLFFVGWVTARAELSLFQNHVSLRRLLPLFMVTIAVCGGGERFYLTVMTLITGVVGTYTLGFLIEKFSPRFARRVMGVEAAPTVVVPGAVITEPRPYGLPGEAREP